MGLQTLNKKANILRVRYLNFWAPKHIQTSCKMKRTERKEGPGSWKGISIQAFISRIHVTSHILWTKFLRASYFLILCNMLSAHLSTLIMSATPASGLLLSLLYSPASLTHCHLACEGEYKAKETTKICCQPREKKTEDQAYYWFCSGFRTISRFFCPSFSN